MDLLCEIKEALQLLSTDDLVGDEDVGDTGLCEDLGFTELLATDPHRSEGKLTTRDLRTLVALGMGS